MTSFKRMRVPWLVSGGATAARAARPLLVRTIGDDAVTVPRAVSPHDSQPTPSLSLSKLCGSGCLTGNRLYGIWLQSKSGGGGGMQTVG